ncbi:sporulation protein YunB [Clostridium fallax]|uniref:Sporulation protein YunB n=1 Tax=Clostridium fallax TaxID=1533 RepID=A0A1M4UAL0_9CLOT|nr:sporulation protein YunB [Clostridium fallax]SHE53590.1 sporulation protein YunB [Clostridium fallax]SQB06155.1 sporulation protein YunB [Clostridium fallax]
MKKLTKLYIITFFIIISIFFSIFIYYLDKNIMPSVLSIGDGEIKSLSTEIINKNILEVCTKEFDYGDIMKIEKDDEGNIVMVRADVVKLNIISSKLALEAQEDLKKIGAVGVKIPLSYVFNNSILGELGPKINVKMVPVGRVDIKYDTEFQSAGINQTRHKIYVEVYAKLKLTVPFDSKDIEVKVQMPIAETIIVGKIPKTSISFDGIGK